jgi:hypothetical protein
MPLPYDAGPQTKATGRDSASADRLRADPETAAPGDAF